MKNSNMGRVRFLSLPLLVGLLTAAASGCGNDEEQVVDTDAGGTTGASSDGDATGTGGGDATGTGGGAIEHQEPEHEEHFENAPSMSHATAHHEHTESNKVSTVVPAPAPNQERVLFATGLVEEGEGQIWMYDPYCRQPDDGSCGDGWEACDYDSCDSYTRSTGYQCSGCTSNRLVGLDEVNDPCDLWYYDKSRGDFWSLHARNSYEYSNELIQELVVGTDTTTYGYEECREKCLADEDCIGGQLYTKSGDPAWTVNCVLFKESAAPLDPAAEVRFPVVLEKANLNVDITNILSASAWLHQQLFSVCADFDTSGAPTPP